MNPLFRSTVNLDLDMFWSSSSVYIQETSFHKSDVRWPWYMRRRRTCLAIVYFNSYTRVLRVLVENVIVCKLCFTHGPMRIIHLGIGRRICFFLYLSVFQSIDLTNLTIGHYHFNTLLPLVQKIIQIFLTKADNDLHSFELL